MIKTVAKYLQLHQRLLVPLAVIILLGVQAGTQVYLAHADSQTTDEAVHLSAGYTYLTRGDYRFNPEHPPLMKMLSALPLLAIHPHLPADQSLWDTAAPYLYDSWRENRTFGEQFLYTSGNNADQLLFLGRLATILLTLLLGLAIFLITRAVIGNAGALLSLTLYVFDPTVAAHGHLITTDIALTLGFVLSVWTFWRFMQKSSLQNGLFLSLALIFAFTVKYTAVILIPTFASIMVWHAVRSKWPTATWLSFLGKMIVIAIALWIGIMAVYRFDFTPPPASNNIVASITSTNAVASPIAAPAGDKIQRIYELVHPVAIPRYYFKGLVMILTHVDGGHPAFLLGQTSHTGWWYYFPVMLLTKTPLPTLLIFGWAVVLMIKRRSKYQALQLFAVAAAAYLVSAMLSKANLGIRHVLPPLPAMMIASGAIVISNARHKLIIAGLITWLIVTFAFAAPFYLPYFNPAALGSGHGWRIATDSNLDWGQDIKRIAAYEQTHLLSDPYVIYPWDGESALDYYHVYRRGDALTQRSSGTVIIGATWLRTPAYEWLVRKPIFDRVAPGVLVYKLDGTP